MHRAREYEGGAAVPEHYVGYQLPGVPAEEKLAER